MQGNTTISINLPPANNLNWFNVFINTTIINKHGLTETLTKPTHMETTPRLEFSFKKNHETCYIFLVVTWYLASKFLMMH